MEGRGGTGDDRARRRGGGSLAALASVVAASVALAGCSASPSRPPTSPVGAAGAAPAFVPYRPYVPPPQSGQAGADGTAPSIAGAAGGGFAGATGAAGTDFVGVTGAAGAIDPQVCSAFDEDQLPLPVGGTFPFLTTLNNFDVWTNEPTADCDQTVFPDLVAPSADAEDTEDGLTDSGAADAAVDAGGDGSLANPDVAAGDDADAGIDAEPFEPDALPPPIDQACFAFSYKPDPCIAANGGDPVAAVQACWSGVIFAVSPIESQGTCVAPGAAFVHFEARASREGANVKWGSTRPGLGESEFFIPVTTAWADYQVAIPAEDYNNEPGNPFSGVWDGFSIVVEPEDHVGGTYIFVRNVFWDVQ
jgi:hypothetical protein